MNEGMSRSEDIPTSHTPATTMASDEETRLVTTYGFPLLCMDMSTYQAVISSFLSPYLVLYPCTFCVSSSYLDHP